MKQLGSRASDSTALARLISASRGARRCSCELEVEQRVEHRQQEEADVVPVQVAKREPLRADVEGEPPGHRRREQVQRVVQQRLVTRAVEHEQVVEGQRAQRAERTQRQHVLGDHRLAEARFVDQLDARIACEIAAFQVHQHLRGRAGRQQHALAVVQHVLGVGLVPGLEDLRRGAGQDDAHLDTLDQAAVRVDDPAGVARFVAHPRMQPVAAAEQADAVGALLAGQP
ncbi:MAG TPA: hypothetical protein VGP22_04030, partial [Albitalea sp.]|nr:hypothetical protein [Albitalea sp.]